MNGDAGMHHANNRGNKGIPLAIRSRILAIIRNPLPEYVGRSYTWIVLVSLIVLLRGFPCFHNFSRGAFHPYIPIHSIE